MCDCLNDLNKAAKGVQYLEPLLFIYIFGFRLCKDNIRVA